MRLDVGPFLAFVAQARRAKRHDLVDFPFLSIAWRALPSSPRGARTLAMMAPGAPRGASLGELVDTRERLPLDLNGTPAALNRALAALTVSPALTRPMPPTPRGADVVEHALRHGQAALLAENPHVQLERIAGNFSGPTPPRHFDTIRKLAFEERWSKLALGMINVEICIAQAAADAQASPFPVICEGRYREARGRWVQRVVAALGTDDARWPIESYDLQVLISERGAHYVEQRGARFLDVDVTMDLAGAARFASAMRRALWALVDIVNEPDPAELPYVERWFAPRWGELLRALDQLAPAPPAREERVVWLIERMPPYLRLEPAVQRANKKGGFTKGSKVSPTTIARGEIAAATEQDRAAAAVMAGSFRADAEVLRLLVGHPLLFDREREPWSVRAETARVHVDDVADGYRVSVRAGGRDLTAADLHQHEGTPTLADPITHEILLVDTTPELVALARLVQRDPIIPHEAAGELHTLAEKLDGAPRVTLAPSLQGESIVADERVFLRLDPEPNGVLCVRVGGRPIPRAQLVPPGLGDVELAGLLDGKRVRVRREFAMELERAARVRERLPIDELEVEHEWVMRARTPDAALALVEALQRCAADETAVVEWKDGKPTLEVRGTAATNGLRVRVKSVHEWLGVEGELEVDGELVTLGALLEAVRSGRRYVPLSGQRFAKLSDELRARIQPLAAFAGDAIDAAGNASTIEVAPSLAGALDDLAQDGARFDDTDAWTDVARRAERARAATDEPPSALIAELRPYQRAGVRFLRRLAAWETGGVLADDMGLGKTVQAIAILVERAHAGPQLVLAPTSVCFNWQRELERFAPSLRVRLLSDATDVPGRQRLLDDSGPRDVIVLGYALGVTAAELLATRRFETVIFDEAQALKNADTQRARMARDLDARFKIALSGTPLENHLGELWSIFRVVSPALFGSHERFRKRYAIPIERDRSLQKRKELAQALRPFLLRRTKNEVLTELPARTEVVQSIDLSPDERTRYDATRAAVLADVMKDDEAASRDRRFRVLAGLTKLRLLACHPRLVDDDAGPESAKLTAIVRTVLDLKDNGHKALVFSQFVKHLAIVRPALEAGGVRAIQLDGSTPAAERARLVDAFQRGDADVFLLSLKAGGAGLNLTAADYVLHLDPWWNPAVEDQATGRAHRIGQLKPVTVYRFVARGTIEEQMVAMHAEKRDLVDGILEGADAAGTLSVDQLVALLRPAPVKVPANEG